MRIAAQTRLAPGETLAEQIKVLAEVGFEGIELSGRELISEPDATIRACRESSLPVSAICAGFGGCFLDPDPQVRRQAIEDTQKILRLGKEARATGMIMVPLFRANRLPELQPLKSAKQLQDELMVAILKEDLAPVAEETGLAIYVEPLNRYEAQYLRTLDDGWTRFVEPTNSPNIQLLADVFHMQLEELDPAAALEKHVSHIGHVHLADRTRQQPGTSDMDYVKPFRALIHGGYEGFTSLECGIHGEKREALAQCASFLKDAREQASS